MGGPAAAWSGSDPINPWSITRRPQDPPGQSHLWSSHSCNPRTVREISSISRARRRSSCTGIRCIRPGRGTPAGLGSPRQVVDTSASTLRNAPYPSKCRRPTEAEQWRGHPTTSQPRSLLSIARLNGARSRLRPSICSLVLIDQTWLGRNGGLAPTSLPFSKVCEVQACRQRAIDGLSWSVSLVERQISMCLR
jgi:hypothetical protein